jgi:hypothetical protein
MEPRSELGCYCLEVYVSSVGSTWTVEDMLGMIASETDRIFALHGQACDTE